MDYHSMSLRELKVSAKNHDPPIKFYYIMKRVKLIQLLTLPELPHEYILEKKTIHQLREEGKERGFRVSNLKRQELVELLYPRFDQNHQNNDHAQKHDDPEEGEGK